MSVHVKEAGPCWRCGAIGPVGDPCWACRGDKVLRAIAGIFGVEAAADFDPSVLADMVKDLRDDHGALLDETDRLMATIEDLRDGKGGDR